MTESKGRKIAMVGATGAVGEPTLAALLESKLHTITAISRTESNATFPSNVHVKKGDYADVSFLASALQGHDVLIMQLSMDPKAMESQFTFIKAAAIAGVPWILPTEFGSDPLSSLAKDFPVMSTKKKYRDMIEEKGLSWIAVVNGPWFEWTLARGMFFIDVPERKATINDVGETKFSASTFPQVGRGVTALLSLPDEKLKLFRNRPVYLQSFLTSQSEVLDSLIRSTGTKETDWEVKIRDPEETIRASRDAVAAGDPSAIVGEFLTAHMQDGRGGNYEEKAIRDAEVLGLIEERLDDVVRRYVDDLTFSNGE
ncbi:hypothetical protein FB567DRAFT_532883 [Paraphoma chrysanthemicola]|uniref:NAD(P)-binding domain-containing protein n=1 Tax=Paraphoma chrysanthemicola TaxID=798071 RepID=A0A8K0R0S7_9PLEO|nr:hypothetical protein FB567DRAFT_532883 [Paraphoma chrysanthemicola]